MNDELEKAENSVAFARDTLRAIHANYAFSAPHHIVMNNIIDTLDELINEIDLLKENENVT